MNLQLIHIVLVENITPLSQIFVEILLKLKKTGALVKLLRGTCSTCKRKKPLIVSDQTIQAEELGDFLNKLAKLLRVSESNF